MSKKSDFKFEKGFSDRKINGIYFVKLTFSKLFRMSDNQTHPRHPSFAVRKLTNFLKFPRETLKQS